MSNPTQSETLLPCLFCGHDDELQVLHQGAADEWWFTVFCDFCCSYGPTSATAEGATAAWNTRPQSTSNETLLRDRIAAAIAPCLERAHNEYQIADAVLQSIPSPLLDEGLVSVRIDPATAQTLMDWNVLHTTDAGWVIDLDIWRSALSIPRLEAGRVTEAMIEAGRKVIADPSIKTYAEMAKATYLAMQACAFCGTTEAAHEPSGCCGDGGGSTFAAPAPDGPALTELEEKSK